MIAEFKDIDNLNSQDFEYFVRDVFEAAGWSDVVVTKVGSEFKHGDGGIDIIAHYENKKFVIEVKQRKDGTPVDIKALNQVCTGAKLQGAHRAILVTNSFFTTEVQQRATKLGVDLLDRDKLHNLWKEKHTNIGLVREPRDYQLAVINKSYELYQSGKSKLLIEMATGLGKTFTVALLIRKILSSARGRGKILFLTHQIEILLQAIAEFRNIFGIAEYSYSGCFGGSSPEDTDFVFACFDTLHSQIHNMNPEVFEYIIVDEAHHTPAKTYSEVISAFNPKLLIGLTATPDRMDSKNVSKFFGGKEGHVGRYDLAWALRNRMLAYPKYMVLLDDLDDSRLSQLQKGISVNDLDKRLFLHKKDEEVVRIIEETIIEKQIENPKAIVFCRSIEHMEYLISFFKLGEAALVHSRMKDLERRDNIKRFREGGFRYILVCDMFNEGVDVPETNILVFLRETRSRTVWLQQLGRGLRKTPIKDFVHVLDFVGSLERLQEIKEFEASIFSIKPEKNKYEESPDELHDASISVEYNKSAAQVLRLIEDLQYRLNTRNSLIELMQEYIDGGNPLPSIYTIENCIPQLSNDQILTHFDSYYRFINRAVPDSVNKIELKNKIMDYISRIVSMTGVFPTEKAISNQFQHAGLIEFTIDDVREIVGEYQKINSKPGCVYEVSNGKVMNENQELRILLIKKYSHSIREPEDIDILSEAEKYEILKVFQTRTGFVRALKKYSNNEY